MEAGSLNKAKNKIDGSCCRYVSIEGHAEILRIQPTPESISQAQVQGGPRYQGYEVWFRFVPAEISSDARLQTVLEHDHMLTLSNSWYIGPRFLKKYGIKTGKTFPGVLKLLVEGTCSPIQFEFRTINLKDFFESLS
jgi:hypothetical protein